MPRTPNGILTHHCVNPFHERSRPALDQLRARAELEALIEHGLITGEAPEWFARSAAQEPDAYLLIGEDVVLPLAANGPLGELVAVTSQ
ncbi:MAG: hypothetical protein EXQ70_11520 [Solirubrobacterales bacterium]|nr:hypothetical protein [Solirubrobacterales bacterium]